MSHLTNKPVALSVKGLSYQISASKVLVSDIDFHVHMGEILVMAGPNGAGKTTLIKMIAGLNEPSSGQILLGDIDYKEIGMAERARKIAYVGQNDDPDIRLSVRQYIELGRLPHRGALSKNAEQELINQAIEVAGLVNMQHNIIAQLSGGEKQRMKVARAICQRPDLLILDEPTNHLDPQARGDLLSLISGLGITVIASLHDLALIEAFATHVAIIKEGQLMSYGHPEEVLSSHMIRNVFNVDMHRLEHPTEKRFIPTLDIKITKPEVLN
jgi:iron complex transport system ATP-binding protein